MKILSMLFYFFAHHGAWAFFVLLLAGVIISFWRNSIFYVVMSFILALANVFTGQFVNAAFLAHFGQTGSAVITLEQETSAMLNDSPIWDYDAVVKTADGKDVVTDFSTTTASIYPIRNEILIPSRGERFVVKYIAGFEKNMVIMSDESAYGIKRKIAENLRPVQKAEGQYNANTSNESFRKEYIQAMESYIENPQNSTDSLNISAFKAVIQRLTHPSSLNQQ
ncbi:hypothetical protein TH53_16420 [Pedobacter lusitanus]|uniref:Uncharacterized protein n=1 Tax=Pedobacter lusitanus TaxID=1503925 RepID=A0A0D0GJ87_9SPHI|nr:hypothetical protein [Pedobacter lusitanus]KIO76195.1 hypothetical protein TH53_16420 [Pedobacter lusitanus]